MAAPSPHLLHARLALARAAGRATRRLLARAGGFVALDAASADASSSAAAKARCQWPWILRNRSFFAAGRKAVAIFLATSTPLKTIALNNGKWRYFAPSICQGV